MAKRPKKRNTVTYQLKEKRKIVRIGTTNNPERREAEHQADGLRFTTLAVTSRRMTDEGAKEKESQQLEQYRQNHGGQTPKYNEDPDG